MNNDNPFLPNQQLREARLQRGWSQQYVADHIETTVVTVKRWERGFQSPGPHFRLKLCTLFGKSAKELGLFPEKPSHSVHELTPALASAEGLPVPTNSPGLQDTTTDLGKDTIDQFAASPFLYQDVQTAVPTTAHQQQNRIRMLRRLRHSYRALLTQSLQGSSWIEVELSQKPDAICNTTTLLSRLMNKREHHLLSGTSIVQIYEDAERELLILGEPGTGKSTLLLHLAQQLTENALLNATYPLPFLLPLSSWAMKHPPLHDWIEEQLTLIYNVPARLAQQWMREEHILPLLDGLDEMDEAASQACIRAINSYHREHIAPLVVCSRTHAYLTATHAEQLTLQMAVVVQSLSAELVDTYLEKMGTPFGALHATLQANFALQAVATTPLMLHILVLTYHNTSAQNLFHTEAQLRQQLWTDYSKHMIYSRGDAKRYPFDTTSTQLGWLARKMRQQNLTIFYLEQVQSDWLEQDASKRVYQYWAVLLPGAFAAGLLGVLASTLLFSSYFTLAIIVLLFTLTGILQTLRGNPTIALTCKTFWKSFLPRPDLLWIPVGCMGGLGAALISFLTHNGSTTYHWQNGLSYGIAIALLSILLRTENSSSAQKKISSRSYRDIKQWFLTNGRDGLSIGFSCAVGFGLHELFRRGQWYALGEGLRYGLLLGGTGFLLSILIPILQMRKAMIEPKETIELIKEPIWSWQRARQHLVAWKHLKSALAIGSSVALIMGVDFLIRGIELQQRFAWQEEGETIIGYGISIGLITLSTYWLQQWYRGGLSQELLPETKWLKPNQRIWSSAYHALLIAGISTLVGWFSYALFYNVQSGAGGAGSTHTFLFGLLFGLAAGALSGLLYGGQICLRHLVLRVLLWRTHVFPWKATPFLEDATARILLRRVGGGYSFTHRLLLDYFADLETTSLNTHPAQDPHDAN